LGLSLSAVGLSQQRFLKEVLIGIGAQLIVVLYAVIFSTIQGVPPRPDWPGTLVSGSLGQRLEIAAWLSKLIVTAVAVGVREEMIYRGLVVGFLFTRWETREDALRMSALSEPFKRIAIASGREGALWLSALVFALVHFEFELPVLMARIVTGYIYGLLYVWRKNLTAAITMHTLHNFCVWAGLLGSA
jgi:membrane protease YdiL (CAAX protease family)